MSSEHLASAQNLLKGNLAGAWDILSGAQGQYESLGIARRFGVAAAAYSLRDIGANGSRVVRVRRSSGSPDEEDFSASQVLSGAVEAFVGSGNDGFVTTLYDQSGNGNDVTQTTTGSQPKIVDSGSQVKVDGIPSIKFDGTNDFLERATYTQGDLSQPNIAFTVAKLRVYVNDNQKIFDGHLNTARNMLFLQNTGGGRFGYFAGNVRNTGESGDANQHLFTAFYSGSSSFLRVDGTQKDTGNAGSQGMQGINIGANHDSASNFWDGDIQEIIIYNSDLSDDKTDLENDINNYYTIY